MASRGVGVFVVAGEGAGVLVPVGILVGVSVGVLPVIVAICVIVGVTVVVLLGIGVAVWVGAADAVPAVDAQRYFQAFPDLKQHALNILTAETKLDPGKKVSGTIVVSFPVTADAFAARKSLTVTITPYNEVPIVLTK